jgi:hypothetical protein
MQTIGNWEYKYQELEQYTLLGNKGRRKLVVLVSIIIATIMVIPVIQSVSFQQSRSQVIYSSGSSEVMFNGNNVELGLAGNIYPVAWNIFKVNRQSYSPYDGESTSTPLQYENLTHYKYSRVVNLYQNSAVMIKWNSNLKIAEIYSFVNGSIDASIAIENLNSSGNFIGDFSMSMKHSEYATLTGLSPFGSHFSRGKAQSVDIPSNDFAMYASNVSISWRGEASIFHTGILTETPSSGVISLPFGPISIQRNETYSIDPVISPSLAWGNPRPPGPIPSPPPPQPESVVFTETGLPSGTSWSVDLSGQSLSSTSKTITFTELPGTYSYSVSQMQYYFESPSSGSVVVRSGYGSSVAVNYTPYGAPKVYSLSVLNNTGSNYSSVIPGETSLSFSFYYKNATGNAPGPGSLGWLFRSGIWVWANTANGGEVPLKAYYPTGNGEINFNWIASPGYYTGFSVTMINEKATTEIDHNVPAMVYTMFPRDNGNLYLGDSTSSSNIYDSNGMYLGSLVNSMHHGANGLMDTDKGSTTFAFQYTFVSPYNNGDKGGLRHYGIYSYDQSITYNGNNVGVGYSNSPNGAYLQWTSPSRYDQGDSPGTLTIAEEVAYSAAVALLGTNPYTIAASVIMAALYPLIFQQSSTPSTSTAYNNVSDSQSASFTWVPLHPYGRLLTIWTPFFQLLDTANGNVSVMEEYAASMEFMDSSGSNGYGINYFSYSTNINVVPVDMQFPGGAQDLVNATWVPNDIYNSYYTYTGPSYSASLSLPFYLVQMQD